MKKGVSESLITNVVIPLIVLIFIIIFAFLLLLASSYSGRLSAKFGYMLSGSVDFLVNKPAQVVESYSKVGIEIALGVTAAVFAVGASAGIESLGEEASSAVSTEDVNVFEVENGQVKIADWAQDVGLSSSDEQAATSPSKWTYFKAAMVGGGKAVYKLWGNPIGEAVGVGLVSAFALSYVTNDLASDIQKPILNFLAPEGIIFINLSDPGPFLNQLYGSLNKTFVNEIESYCNNPSSAECENIVLTYLIAKYLYYTWGETLGQSVAIAGDHPEYFIGYASYNSTYNVTQQGVLCMLGMMDYFGQNPLQQMYGLNLSEFLNNYVNKNYDGDLICNIAAQVLDISLTSSSGGTCGANNANIPSEVIHKVVFVTYDVSNDELQQYSCPSGNTHADYNVIVPNDNTLYSGYLQYMYDGGTQGIIITSVYG